MSDPIAKIIDIGDESMLGHCDDGRKIWLEGPAVPGDTVRFQIDGNTGTILEVLEPSPERLPATCPHFEHCPGCQLQPLPYKQQLQLKGQKIIETLRRLGGVEEVPFQGIIGSPDPFGTRNKLDFTIEGQILGYQTRNGLLPVTTCPVGHPLLNDLLPAFQEWLNTHPRNQLHRLLLRCDGPRKQVHALLRGTLSEKEETTLINWAKAQPAVNHLSIQTDWQSPWESLLGDGQLNFELAGESHSIEYDAFFQVHDPLAHELILECMSWLGAGKGPLLDLFCGAGAFTFPALKLGWQVLGLDSRPGKGPLKQADLRKGISKKLLKQSWDIILTDPPRSGMEEILCSQIRDHLQPKKILYTSCNPATLARDLKRICAKGSYKVVSVKGFDLFPQTTHVETLVMLERGS